MSWKEIRYYPITMMFVIMMLMVSCSIVMVIGKHNDVDVHQTDDPTTDVKLDSINVLTTEKENKKK